MTQKHLFSYFALLLFTIANIAMTSCDTSETMLELDEAQSEVTAFVVNLNESGMSCESETSYSGGAPFNAHFEIKTENPNNHEIRYEWRFTKDGQEKPFLIRYSASTDYCFKESGTFYITCVVSVIEGDKVSDYEMESPIAVNIANSKLEFPTSFTPNGDGINDSLKVKAGYESIVSFQATVLTRSGKRIYEWTNPAGGWDGTMNGRGGTPAPDGFYNLVLKARGADGLKYDRKMVINLLREYNEAATGAN